MATATQCKRSVSKRGETNGRDGQVFPFRLVCDDLDEAAVEPATHSAAKDEALRVLWKHIRQLSSSRLAGFLPIIARFGHDSPEAHQLSLDTGDETRDALLEETWSYLRNWSVEDIIAVIPTFVECAAEDSGRMLTIDCPRGHAISTVRRMQHARS